MSGTLRRGKTCGEETEREERGSGAEVATWFCP